MNKVIKKQANRALRKSRIQQRVKGTAERPRLTVSISNLHVTAQVIDDTVGRTLAYATTVGDSKVSGSMTAKAALIGTAIAKKAKAAKVSKVVFDRNGRIYQGRLKALADAARQGGLEF